MNVGWILIGAWIAIVTIFAVTAWYIDRSSERLYAAHKVRMDDMYSRESTGPSDR